MNKLLFSTQDPAISSNARKIKVLEAHINAIRVRVQNRAFVEKHEEMPKIDLVGRLLEAKDGIDGEYALALDYGPLSGPFAGITFHARDILSIESLDYGALRIVVK